MTGKLDLYRIFHTVCRSKSFSKAAQALYMTQPAISQAMAQLEKELGTHLFYRTPKGVTLTSEGELLHGYVKSALGILEAGEEKMLEFQNLSRGQLRIGVGDTISRYYLLPALEAFYKKYPRIKLKVLNGTTSEIVSYLKAGEADLGICNLPVRDEQLHVSPCKDIHDIFVCGEKYKNMARHPVNLAFLMKMPLIFLERKANSRRYVEDYLKGRGFVLSPEFELGSHELLLEFARINLGIACVTKEFSKDYLDRGLVHEVKLQEPIPMRSIGICHLKSVPLSRAAEKFIDLIHA